MNEWNPNLEVLPMSTQKALEYAHKETWLAGDNWYLAGGTALALQVGHRQSVDLDFFTQEKTFAPAEVTRHFPDTVWQGTIVKEGTIYGTLCKAKVSFIAYPFFVPVVPPLKYGSVAVLDKDDIAVMKIVAISQRGKKRDFVDLFWYAKNVTPLESVIQKLPRQYPDIAHSFHHIIKALTYFEDAESDPMPALFFDATWEDIKTYFRKEVASIAKKLLKLD
ncbi:MAG: hypothetical protein COV91_01720 [Candidatus Taylorbacteria bacterium CG11_big_fil_rev_8_21_14_0_20_46_11]|uniref:Nucleotidyl transferase AbiEii/AbiGii toxin family protein n=1 Tax=Candidatus Taylorbacteria bacterium CG11_big_fil_rev_8_21_14_0_20_46_11 TaxID=1975025 RepID=A0A2H0KCC1_9BACT|nr:MAG: hypothetical protein COV91_01720 [Candidatus Taylorbacteria bacterium CG11_big_fil_rev_8_21_14_0_20_46_11]